jgi:sialic acid synthase SpsE
MLNVREAEEKDSADIYEWRNDELTRQMAHTTDLVEWEGHSKWFAASLINENRLLVICDLKKGSIVKNSDVRRIRPGYGLPPKYHDEIIGKVLSRDIERGDPVTWDTFK